LAASLAVLHATSATAQRIVDAHVAAGTPLRVVLTNGESRRGRYLAESPSHLKLSEDCGADCQRADSVAWSDMRRVDAEITIRHSGGRAFAFGLLGAAVGAAVAVGGVKAYESGDSCTGDLCGIEIVYVLPVLTGAGAIIGVHHGWTHPARFWAPVWPPSATR
jgi:hypothetical protein